MWEYMLREDREHDLADLSAAKQWALRGEPPGDRDPWVPGVVATWMDGVHTLRSLAPRLKKRKGREPAISPEQADNLFGDFLRMLRPSVVTRGEGPIRTTTFVGVRLSPLADVNDPRMRQPWGNWAMTVDHIWAGVFGSMVSDDFAPVCSRCGQELGTTPKGRRPRAGMCSKCRYANWYAKQPKAKMRARWRANKAAQREQE